MNNELREKDGRNVGEVRKRREVMADGKRYIIYYTFGEDSKEFSENAKEIIKENIKENIQKNEGEENV